MNSDAAIVEGDMLPESTDKVVSPETPVAVLLYWSLEVIVAVNAIPEVAVAEASIKKLLKVEVETVMFRS